MAHCDAELKRGEETISSANGGIQYPVNLLPVNSGSPLRFVRNVELISFHHYFSLCPLWQMFLVLALILIFLAALRETSCLPENPLHLAVIDRFSKPAPDQGFHIAGMAFQQARGGLFHRGQQ